MKAIIFYHVAEYCDFTSKYTIRLKGKKVKMIMWDSMNKTRDVDTDKFKTKKKAYKAYLKRIGQAVEGGWRILNAFPDREKWKEKEEE